MKTDWVTVKSKRAKSPTDLSPFEGLAAHKSSRSNRPTTAEQEYDMNGRGGDLKSGYLLVS